MNNKVNLGSINYIGDIELNVGDENFKGQTRLQADGSRLFRIGTTTVLIRDNYEGFQNWSRTAKWYDSRVPLTNTHDYRSAVPTELPELKKKKRR